MIKAGLSAFKGKSVLLLQGPMGPFFRRLARDLEESGACVHKVNFNGGDWLFYPVDSIAYRGKSEDWPAFFDQLLTRQNIDVVMLFGDCRSFHRVAHQIAQLRGIEVGVFEEGYIRPDFITLERFGTNGNSQIPREQHFYLDFPVREIPPPESVGKPFWYAAMWAIVYYLASAIMWPMFWRYQHHRPLNPLEGLLWVRSLWRKWYYAFAQRNELKDLVANHDGKFFLVPLQVHNDAQIHFHSSFDSVKVFIRQVMHSFAVNAPSDTLLVIKHHPMDRAYHDYARYLTRIARKIGVEGRVRYIHDQHLPTLFDHARGVVVVNSTAGLSALDHGVPVKVCGSAIYDIPGLTFQGEIDQFWHEAPSHSVDETLHHNFLNYVISHTQLNGNYYKRLSMQGSRAGVIWNEAGAPVATEMISYRGQSPGLSGQN